MRIGERLLLALSRNPQNRDYHMSVDDVTVEKALDLLINSFGTTFLSQIRGKKLLDYGCGRGMQCIALALNGADRVVGLDIREGLVDEGRKLARQFKVSDKISFINLNSKIYRRAVPEKGFDIIISQNSFEHYSNPTVVLEKFKHAIKPDGKIYITFGNPWYHPYGSHMQYFTMVPWVHLIFSEQTVMAVRRRFRHDGATKYREVEGGLNQITIRQFKDLIQKTGYKIQFLQLRAIKRLNFMSKFPVIQELFTNRINCILSLP